MTGSIVGPVDTETLTWASGPFNAAVSSDGTKVVLSVNDGDATFTLQVDKIVASRPIELPLYAIEDNHAARVDYVNQRIAALGVPTPQTDKLGGVFAAEAQPGFAQYGISTSGAPIFKEIAVPYPAPAKLGGLYSTTALSGKYISAINTDGTVAYGDLPAGVDLSAYLPLAGGTMTGTIKVPDSINALQTASNFNIIGNNTGMFVRQGTTNLWSYGVNSLTAYKPISLPADPTTALQAATKQYVDSKVTAPYVLPTASATVLGGVKVGVGLAVDANGVLSASGGSTAYLPLAGGTMAGYITLHANPADAMHPTPKQYVDAYLADKVAKSGDTMTGLLTLSGNPSAAMHATPKQYVDASVGSAVMKNGDNMTGLLKLSGPPTDPLHAATKAYVDSLSGGSFLPLAGGTMTGAINVPATMDFISTPNGYGLYDNATGLLIRKGGTSIIAFGSAAITATVPVKLPADPTDALHAATKQYVDSFTSTAYVRKSGDVMSGPLRFSPSAYSGGQNGTDAYLYMDTAYIRLIAPSGKQVFVADPTTGIAQFLGGAPQTAFSPTVDNDLANKKYVDGRLPTTGGTMTGTITMPTSIAGFQYGTTGYNVFGGSGGVAVRSNTTNIVIFAGANITNLVPMVTPATGVGVQFGSGGVTLSRGSAATKIAFSGMIELPTTAPAAGEAVRKDYVDGRVVVTAVGAAAPATTGLSNGALWVEA
jgi:hypothetical protein